jgi:hypothetical protein
MTGGEAGALLSGPRGAEPVLPFDAPNTGPFDIEVISDAVAALFEKIGPATLVTHLQAGGPGWRTAIKSENVRVVAPYEPGSNFLFPEGEVPPPMASASGPLERVGVPLSSASSIRRAPRTPAFSATPTQHEHAQIAELLELSGALTRSSVRSEVSFGSKAAVDGKQSYVRKTLENRPPRDARQRHATRSEIGRARSARPPSRGVSKEC